MMKPAWIIFFSLTLSLSLAGQVTEENNFEQQLEDLAEMEEGETDDDSYLQTLQAFSRHRLDLNQATEGDLQLFRFLNPIQINSFFSYKRLLGPLLNLYELQAIPGWDLQTIRSLLPYVMVGPSMGIKEDIKNRISGGDHSLTMRWSRILETARGFKGENGQPPKYLGSPDRLLLRYKYQYKTLFQYGFVAEKDAGEQIFRGKQQYGFDFYSGHLFMRNVRRIRQLAVGDFTVNMGQGLLVYQSMAFRKGVDVMNIKRQSETFRPYNSAGEYNFFRGAAATVNSGNFELSVFGAMRKITTTATVSDTTEFEDYISSLLMSGFHRTENEAARRYNTRQMTTGGSIRYRANRMNLAANIIHHNLGLPMQKRDAPYNQYTFSGKNLTGLSLDWSYTWKNLHGFGEIAHSVGSGKAVIAGLMASLHTRVDLSMVYRRIDRDYHSLYSNAFTESTVPINESGLFTGLSFRASSTVRIDAYADVYKFPWLRYRVDRPSQGKDQLVQITWRPGKQFELYSRYKTETKSINLSNTVSPFHQTEDVPRRNWRTHYVYKISPSFTTRGRVEWVWYNDGETDAESGFLIFADIIYKPMMGRLSGNFRLQYFETDGYNSRVYAYENDVLYSYSIPPFFDKGYRGYLNFSFEIARSFEIWTRIARSIYTTRESIGSGYDLISGNTRTDIKIQLRYIF